MAGIDKPDETLQRKPSFLRRLFRPSFLHKHRLVTNTKAGNASTDGETLGPEQKVLVQ